MTIDYLGTPGDKIRYPGDPPDTTPGAQSGKVSLPEVATAYERVGCQYPDRAARYCLPTYQGGRDAAKPILLWQWERDGHEPRAYGSADPGQLPVAHAPAEELARLSNEITAALDRRHAEQAKYPDCAGYFASCRRYGAIMQGIDDHYAALDTFDAGAASSWLRSYLHGRRKIDRQEVADILRHLSPPEMQQMSPEEWSRIPRGITFVSLVGGGVRYDQPGTMHPLQQSVVSFVPATMDRNSVDYIRRHALRVVRIAA